MADEDDLLLLALCPECWCEVDIEELVTSVPGNQCPSCKKEVWVVDLLAYGDIDCEWCDNPIDDTDALYCPTCDLHLNDKFWEKTKKQLNGEWLDILDQLNERADAMNSIGDVPDVSSIAYDYTICCNEQPENCMCDLKLDWNDARSIPKSVDEQAYDYYSSCSSCIHWYTATCLPYRSWQRDFLEGEGTIPPAIDFCSYRVPDPRVVSISARR